MISVRNMAVLLLAGVLLLAACSDDEDEFPSAPGFQEPGATATAPAGNLDSTPVPPGDDDDDSASQNTPVPATDSGNVFQAADAGEVELALDGGDLVLVAVRPSDGWEYRVDDEDDDEIEIDFRQSGREIDFEAELDDGRLEIDVCDTVIDPDGDVYTVADAGEVEARRGQNDDDDDDGNLELIDVRPNDGWTHEVEEDDDEIEIEFRRDNERVKFDLEIDDGRLEAKSCTRSVVNLDDGEFPASGTPGDGSEHRDDDDDDDDGDDDD